MVVTVVKIESWSFLSAEKTRSDYN
jgi:hypothetical protein